MKKEIIAQYFFTGKEASLGEAANNCTPNTKIKDIIYDDGTLSDLIMENTYFCVVILEGGEVVTGTYTSDTESPSDCRSKAREVAYERMK